MAGNMIITAVIKKEGGLTAFTVSGDYPDHPFCFIVIPAVMKYKWPGA